MHPPIELSPVHDEGVTRRPARFPDAGWPPVSVPETGPTVRPVGDPADNAKSPSDTRFSFPADEEAAGMSEHPTHQEPVSGSAPASAAKFPQQVRKQVRRKSSDHVPGGAPPARQTACQEEMRRLYKVRLKLRSQSNVDQTGPAKGA